MIDDRPAPLVPAEVDLRDFQFMPLHVVRLRDSDLTTESSGEEFKAAVLLWSAAWHQVPAGSMPNSDKWMAKHSGAGLGWRKVKTGALRGWIECDDGRLHHPVLAEVANDSWRKKQEQRAKTLKARIAAAEKRLRAAVTAVDKSQSQTILDGLLQELSQFNARSVTEPVASVTASNISEVEVKGRSSKPASERTPSRIAGAGDSHGTVEKGGRTNGKTDNWQSMAWVTATANTLGMPRLGGETDEGFADRVHTTVNARRRAAEADAKRRESH